MPKTRPPVTPPPRKMLAAADSSLAQALLAQRLFWASVICLALAAAALAVDLPITYAFLGEAGPIWTEVRDGIHKLVRPAETFANGLGVLFMLFIMYAIDVAHRRGLLRMAVVVFGAGIWANIVKASVARARPRVFFDTETGAFAGGVFDTFRGWLPLNSFGYGGQSLPSGHTATAVALAIVLSRRWPHASWAFFTVAGMSVMQRICYGHHYLSDCFAGAALACVVAAIATHPRLVGRWFDRFESRGTSKAAPAASEANRPAASPPPRSRRAA